MTDKERIEAIMSHYHLNNVAFCNKVGLNQATLSNILRGSTNPSLPVMRTVLDAFPEISPLWMFVGQGEMIITAPADSDTPSMGNAQDDLGLFSGLAGSADDPQFGSLPFANPPSSDSRMPAHSSARPSSSAQVSVPTVSVNEIVTGVVSQLQKPTRKITEVRIFFDDGTYETFSAR